MQSRLYAMRKDKLKMTQEEIANYLGISTLSYRNKKRKSEFTQDENVRFIETFRQKV